MVPEDEKAPPEAGTAIASLRRAVNEFMAAQQRLRSRSQRLGQMVPPGGLGGLVKLMTEPEMTSTALARASGRSPATISEQLQRLEANGVVHRRRDETDGRVVWVSLTDKGRGLVATAMHEWDRRFREAFAGTSDDELVVASEVLQGLARLYDSLAGGDEP